MHDNTETLDKLRRQHPHLAPASERLSKKSDALTDQAVEESCLSFGFLRGLHDRALMIEFRLGDGNTLSFPYGWLGPVSYNPSIGLLLKFTGDLVYLVLLCGSNLDALVKGSVNLTDRGINRHRIVWVKEMEKEELHRAREGEPTIDRIEVAEFESKEELQEWLKRAAPAFVKMQK